MAIGVRTAFIKTADTAFAADTVLATVGLTSPIAAGQTQKIRAWVPFSVGAAGGVKVQIVVPAGGAVFIASINIQNTVAPSSTIATQTASAALGAAVANAGTHWMEVEATIVNGATAGNVDLQFAQNSAANTTTILRGAEMEVIKF